MLASDICHAFRFCQVAAAEVPLLANPTLAACTGYTPYVAVCTSSNGVPRYSSNVPCRNNATKLLGAPLPLPPPRLPPLPPPPPPPLVAVDGTLVGAIPVTVAGEHSFEFGPQTKRVVTSRSVKPPEPPAASAATSRTRVARVGSDPALTSSNINVLVPVLDVLCFRSQSADRFGNPVVACLLPTIDAGTGDFSVQYGAVSALPCEHATALLGAQSLAASIKVHERHCGFDSHAAAQSLAV